MKLFVLIFFMLTLLTGCGLDIQPGEEYFGQIIIKPPDSAPFRMAPYSVHAYCQECGECIPEHIKIMCTEMWPTCVNSCSIVYRCSNTEEEFIISLNACDKINWVNYWQGQRPIPRPCCVLYKIRLKSDLSGAL